jgi:hypothetical protein
MTEQSGCVFVLMDETGWKVTTTPPAGGTHSCASEFSRMGHDSRQPHQLPDWLQSIGARLRHDLNGDMTDMPEKMLRTLMGLFKREESQAGGDAAGVKEPGAENHRRGSDEPR